MGSNKKSYSLDIANEKKTKEREKKRRGEAKQKVAYVLKPSAI
jgi:hypothetical protein